VIYETNTKNYMMYNGSSWNTMSNSANFAATGGTITTSGSYTIHRFTSSGDFVITGGQSRLCDILVVGAGGAGGGTHAGGGGAGEVIYRTDIFLSPNTYKIIVGSGAVFGSAQGGPSWFNEIRALGGGSGGYFPGGGNGAGGTTWVPNMHGYQAGSGAVSPWRGGGGAGAGGNGSDGNNATSGGVGISNSITGTAVFYGGGGGAGRDSSYGSSVSLGGSGGGGAGGAGTVAPVAGTANTGGGGGGGGHPTFTTGATGGSGVVIVRYLT
jgi:hypothetical protein